MIEERIYLSPPHQSGDESEAFRQVLASNWLAPAGPDLKAFEHSICELTGFKYAVATSSGTAALHLGLRLLDIRSTQRILSSSMTFVGAVNPILYEGCRPVFIDAEAHSWNLDPNLIEDYLYSTSQPIGALLPTHLYGMPADVIRLEQLGAKYDLPLLHDLAECLAGKVQGKPIGRWVERGVLSFNGNKLITTSGGGAYLTNHKEEAERALFLATQAKEGGAYLHNEMGFNYRMSNVLAALGNAQLKAVDHKLLQKKNIFERYQRELEPLEFEFQNELENITSDRWLTCTLIPERLLSTLSVAQLVAKMNEVNIEIRPMWKPMHLQPLFKNEEVVGGNLAEGLFRRGICLPSGCGLTPAQQTRVLDALKSILKV